MVGEILSADLRILFVQCQAHGKRCGFFRGGERGANQCHDGVGHMTENRRVHAAGMQGITGDAGVFQAVGQYVAEQNIGELGLTVGVHDQVGLATFPGLLVDTAQPVSHRSQVQNPGLGAFL